MNKDSQQLIAGYPRQQIIRIIAAVVVVIALIVGYKVFISEPSAVDSAKVVCEMRTGVDTPLLDGSQSNTREDLAKSLRDRAAMMQNAADKTGGDINTALQKYADAMEKIADSISADAIGASLAEAVSELATNPDIANAEKIIKSILETRCN